MRDADVAHPFWTFVGTAVATPARYEGQKPAGTMVFSTALRQLSILHFDGLVVVGFAVVVGNGPVDGGGAVPLKMHEQPLEILDGTAEHPFAMLVGVGTARPPR